MPNVYIADVGTFANKKPVSFKSEATAFWMAPELFDSVENSPPPASSNINNKSNCDIFSLGLIALYCLDNTRFKTYTNEDGKNILNRGHKTLAKYLKLLEKYIPACFLEFLRQMLAFCPLKRPDIQLFFNDYHKFKSILNSKGLLAR